jgi:predicted RNA-binding protein
LISNLIGEFEDYVNFTINDYSSVGRIDYSVKSDAFGARLLCDPVFLGFFEVNALSYRPCKKMALLLPCNSFKPEIACQTHFMTLRNLKKHGLLQHMDVWVVAEPIGLYAYRDVFAYPVANYDFPPRYVGIKTKTLMSQRLREWYDRVGQRYDVVLCYLTRYYRELAVNAFAEVRAEGDIIAIRNRHRLHSRSEQRRLTATARRILKKL